MNFIKEKILHPLKMQWYEMQIQLRGAWWFFCKQQHQQEKKMQMMHYQGEEELDYNNAVVFSCNGYIWHGGLADRLKGLVTIYDWCKRNNRGFMINFSEPFKLQDYLVPNAYKWLPLGVSYNREQAEPRICLMEPRTCNRKEVQDNQNALLEAWMDANLSDNSCQLHVYTNMYRSDVDFSKCFNELFCPCERLQKEVEYHKQKIGGKYISISFRFTTLLGDFTDCTGAPLPENEREEYIQTCLNAIHEIHKTAPAHDCILITADSRTFLERVQYENWNTETAEGQKLLDTSETIETMQPLRSYIIPGKVGHIDYDHGDDVNMKTFLDFLMIADAEAVYLVKHGKMYGSAFAKTAAMVNNKVFTQYEC